MDSEKNEKLNYKENLIFNEEDQINFKQDKTDEEIDKILDDLLVKLKTGEEENKIKIYALYLIYFSKPFTKKFLPVSIVFLIYIMINLVNLLFVTHSENSDKELPYALNLGLSLYLLLGLSTSFGLNSCLDTLCSNSYGAKLYYLMGCYLNRALIIVSLLFIPVGLIMFFFKDILIASGQEEVVAIQVEKFILGILPGMIFFFWTDAMRRFIQAQGVLIPSIFIVFLTSLIHPIWVYLLFNVFDLGLFGIGLSTTITNIFNFILIIIVLKKYSHKECLVLINKDAFKGWKEFLGLALPSMFLMCLETWNYQIVNFLMGYLRDFAEENVNSYITSFSEIIIMFPFGLSVAGSNIIGRLVGKFDTNKTALATKLIMIFCFVLTFVVNVFIIILKNFVPQIYTTDVQEITIMNDVMWFFSIYCFFQILTDSYAGIYRGLGMQKIIAFANFIAYYIFSLPLTYLFAFVLELKVLGVWVSYAISIFVLVSLYSIIHYKFVDFNKICEEAGKRMSRDTYILSNPDTNEENKTLVNDNRKTTNTLDTIKDQDKTKTDV